MTANQYWNEYLSSTGKSSQNYVFSGELCFEDRGITGTQQAFLIQQGKKCCCFTPFESFQINMEMLPITGEVYIVEDKNENPLCIIEVDDVIVLPFKDITWEMAKQEGEDLDFAQWKERQFEYMKEEADLCGFDFSPDSKVVFEHFHLIYK